MKLDLNLGYFLDSDAFPNVTSFSSKVGSKVTTYSIRDIVPQSDASFTITNAHPNNYPFDSYTTNVTISAMDSTTKKPLHIAFGFFGGLTYHLLFLTISGWGIALEVFDIGDNILMTIQLTRSNTTILFSLFIMLIMYWNHFVDD
ncbi:hypothetical protein BC833DRAFT_589887 [Globomyces pollinis-pini]|nr:hypothetical protein BC833DRAFT_589887 [Globomyces pollinis-pini]